MSAAAHISIDACRHTSAQLLMRTRAPGNAGQPQLQHLCCLKFSAHVVSLPACRAMFSLSTHTCRRLHAFDCVLSFNSCSCTASAPPHRLASEDNTPLNPAANAR